MRVDLKSGIALSLLAVVQTGCAVNLWPHRKYETPRVVGQLTEGSRPIRAQVLLASGDGAAHCEGKVTTTSSAADGSFVFEPHRKIVAWVIIMAHCDYTWSLCVEKGETWENVYQSNEYTLCDTGPSGETSLDCDLARTDSEICAAVRTSGSAP